jgi:hypothetical protein
MPRALGITALCALLAFLVVGVTPTDPTAVTDAGAQRALDAVTSETFDPAHPGAAFPADFAAVMGYRPVAVISAKGNPILIKPAGDCSAFAGDTRYRFGHVCMEHDLAYDVLRYSAAIGRPLPAEARLQADAMFRRELHANCTWSQWSGVELAVCHGWAEAFAEAVEFNSWRQGYRPPPLRESVARWSLCCLVFAVLIVARRTMDRMSEPTAPLSVGDAR